MNKREIGKKLRKLRGEKTQEEVAKSVGITKTALGNYENGIRMPRDEVKLKLSAYYGKTVEELFFCVR